MKYEPGFTSASPMFTLYRPGGVIIAMGQNLVELNLSTADEIVKGDGIAVPHRNL